MTIECSLNRPLFSPSCSHEFFLNAFLWYKMKTVNVRTQPTLFRIARILNIRPIVLPSFGKPVRALNLRHPWRYFLYKF